MYKAISCNIFAYIYTYEFMISNISQKISVCILVALCSRVSKTYQLCTKFPKK